MGQGRTTARGAAINIVATVFKLGLNILVVVPILARVLGPEIFGLVAMAMTLFMFLAVFGDFGLGPALVRNRDYPRSVWESSFWATLFIGVGFSVFAYLTAPALAAFYDAPEVTPLARVLGVAILLQILCSIPIAWLQREQQLGRVAVLEAGSVLVSGGVALWMGLSGAGAWALVMQQLVLAVVRFALAFGLSRFDRIIRFHFAWGDVAPMLGFSFRLTGSGLVAFVSRRSDSILIGRYLGPEMIGLYSRAFQLMQLPNQVIAKGFGFASYPAMAKVAHDPNWLSLLYLKQLGAMSFVSFPLMIALAVLSQPLILTLLGPQWVTIAPTFSFLAIAGLVQAFTAGGADVFKVLGLADRVLYWSIVRLCVFVPCFVIGVWLGSTLWLAILYSIANVVVLVPYQLELARRLNQSGKDHLEQMAPALAASLVMAVVLFPAMSWATEVIPVALFRFLALSALAVVLYFGALRVMFAKFMFLNLGHAQHLLRK